MKRSRQSLPAWDGVIDDKKNNAGERGKAAPLISRKMAAKKKSAWNGMQQ